MDLDACAAPGCRRSRSEALHGYCKKHGVERGMDRGRAPVRSRASSSAKRRASNASSAAGSDAAAKAAAPASASSSASASRRTRSRPRPKTPRSSGPRSSPRSAAAAARAAPKAAAAPSRSRSKARVKVGRRRRRPSASGGAKPRRSASGKARRPAAGPRGVARPAKSASARAPPAGGNADDDDDEDGDEPAEDHFECGGCGEAFLHGTQYLTALGRGYHHECFVCAECGVELGQSPDEAVYSSGGKPYCERDFQANFARRCARCGDDISGKFFRAMDRDWHPDCLSCYDCGESLAGQPIYRRTAEEGGDEDGGASDSFGGVFCERDFKANHAEKCAGCAKPLHGKILRAMDEGWHPECFRCGECDEPLGAAFFVNGNNAYCERDHEKLFATRCGGCGEAVHGKCLRAVDRTYHPACFVCTDCKEPLQTDRFFQDGDDVYCERDYEKAFASPCAGCQKPVTGTVLHVLGQDWHKECFRCSECDRPLKGSFLQKDGKLFCQDDYSRLFDLTCAGCDQTLDGDYVDVLGFQWHRHCFLCTTCLQPIEAGSCFVQDNRVYCARDFRLLLMSAKGAAAAAAAQAEAEAGGGGGGGGGDPASPAWEVEAVGHGSADPALLAAAEADLVDEAESQGSRPPPSPSSSSAAGGSTSGATLPSSSAGGRRRPRKARLLVKSQRYGALTLSESARLGAKAALSRSYSGRLDAPPAPAPPGDSDDDDDGGDDGAPAAAAAAATAHAAVHAKVDSGAARRPGSRHGTASRNAFARYDVASCLAAGLAESLGAVALRRSSRKDFKQKHEFPSTVAAGSFDFVDYCPLLFNAIRLQFGITLESYTRSVARRGAIHRGGPAYGEPGASEDVFYSADGRFVLRTLTVEQHGFFLRIFPAYFRYLTRHRHTLLPHFYGLHKIKLPGRKQPVRVLVCNNVLDSALPVDRRYALKGFTEGRGGAAAAKDMPPGASLRDGDLAERVRVPDSVAHCLRQQLNRDSAFLKENHVHGQTFLLGVHDAPGGGGSDGSASFGSEALLRPLVAHPRGASHGLVSVFQSARGGLASRDGRHVYFAGLVDILQEWGSGGAEEATSRPGTPRESGGGGGGGEDGQLPRSDTRSFVTRRSSVHAPLHSRRYANRLFEFVRQRMK